MELRHLGPDPWGRDVFVAATGQTLVDVDGQLHSMTADGEPLAPVGQPTPTPTYAIRRHDGAIFPKRFHSRAEANAHLLFKLGNGASEGLAWVIQTTD